MAWAEHVQFFLDDQTFGGVVHERLLAAIVLAEGLYCGLVLSMGSTGAPTVDFWEHIDDLERSGFTSIPVAKARAISDALPRFLEQLERAEKANGERRRANGPASERQTPSAKRRVRQRWSAFDPTPEVPAYPPELESRLERQKGTLGDPDAYEGG